MERSCVAQRKSPKCCESRTPPTTLAGLPCPERVAPEGFLSDWCLQSELVSRPGATRSTGDAHGEEHAPPHTRDTLCTRCIPRRYRDRIRDFPHLRRTRPSLQRDLRRTRTRRDRRHECVRQRHAPGPRQADRARDDEWLSARKLHESNLRDVQRQGGAQGQDGLAAANGASCPRMRGERRQQRLLLRNSDRYRRDSHLRRRPRSPDLQRHLRQNDRERAGLPQRRDPIPGLTTRF